MIEKKIQSFEKEREYLEGLLNSRFNFYLVFASLFLVAVLNKDAILTDKQRIVLLFAGASVSLLIALSVLRTNIRVNQILEWLEKNAPDHPWSTISKKPIWIVTFRAGTYLTAASLLITSLFFGLAVWQLKR